MYVCIHNGQNIRNHYVHKYVAVYSEHLPHLQIHISIFFYFSVIWILPYPS